MLRAVSLGLVCLVAAALLVGCAKGSSREPIWREAPDGSLEHVPYGIRFPIRLGDLLRSSPRHYDETGRDVSVGYNRPSPRLTVTVYLYPPGLGEGLTPEQEFIGAMQAIQYKWDGVEIVSSMRTEITLGSGTRTVYVGLVRGDLLGRTGMESFVVVTRYDEVAVKLRASFPDGDEQAVWRELLVVLEHVDAEVARSAPR